MSQIGLSRCTCGLCQKNGPPARRLVMAMAILLTPDHPAVTHIDIQQAPHGHHRDLHKLAIEALLVGPHLDLQVIQGLALDHVILG